MKLDILENLGLSRNESKVYLALIGLGSASVSEISKKADVHRVNIYDALERLIEKGFVGSVLKSNKKYFEASPPEKINILIEEKEKKINEVKSLLPSLEELYKSSRNPHEIHSFKGVLGVKTILSKILDSKPSEILNFGSTKRPENFPKLQIDIWEDQRIKLKISMKILTSEKIAPSLKKRKLQKIKFINKQFDSFTSTIVWEGGVAIFMWIKEPLAILIESRELANSYKEYFYSLWGAAN